MDVRRSLCLTAAWVTLLEAVVWGAVCTYCIGVFNCAWDYISTSKDVSIWSRLYITYLLGGCNGLDELQHLGYSSSLTPPTGAASSLQIWLWVSAVLSIVWAITCFLLLAAVKLEVKRGNGALLYFLWEALTIVFIVLDFAGTIYHAFDIFQATNPDDYAKFSYNTSWENLTQLQSRDEIIAWLPSLIVTLFFCRFVILWFINIYFVFFVNKASKAVSLHNEKDLQSSLYNTERKKSWWDMFYHSMEPITSQNQERNYKIPEDTDEHQDHIKIAQESPNRRYRTDQFGIPVEEFNSHHQRSGSQSPYPMRRTAGHSSRPESFIEHLQDTPPPLAGEIKVPPELRKNRPFSYMAGDQPELVSRSNSRLKDYPKIPRPDYTIADRRAASLEYIPNRFKVPSPKQHLQKQNSFNYNQSPQPMTNLRHVKISNGHKKTEQFSTDSQQSKYGEQIQIFYTSHDPHVKEYNINKLY